jgi:hypothetical protein
MVIPTVTEQRRGSAHGGTPAAAPAAAPGVRR